MKKTYLKPETIELELETLQIMADSGDRSQSGLPGMQTPVETGDGNEDGTSNGQDGDGSIRSKAFDFWTDDFEDEE